MEPPWLHRKSLVKEREGGRGEGEATEIKRQTAFKGQRQGLLCKTESRGLVRSTRQGHTLCGHSVWARDAAAQFTPKL